MKGVSSILRVQELPNTPIIEQVERSSLDFRTDRRSVFPTRRNHYDVVPEMQPRLFEPGRFRLQVINIDDDPVPPSRLELATIEHRRPSGRDGTRLLAVG